MIPDDPLKSLLTFFYVMLIYISRLQCLQEPRMYRDNPDYDIRMDETFRYTHRAAPPLIDD